MVAVTTRAGKGSELTFTEMDTNLTNLKAAVEGGEITSAAAKTTPADADLFGLIDSAASNVWKKFSWASLKAAVLSYIVSTVNTWTKAQIGSPVALNVSSNAIAIDMSLGNNFSVTLQATNLQILSNPTNAVAGQSGNITINQHATNPSPIGYAGNWKEVSGSTTDNSVSATASAQNVLSYYVADSTHIWYRLHKNGVA